MFTLNNKKQKKIFWIGFNSENNYVYTYVGRYLMIIILVINLQTIQCQPRAVWNVNYYHLTKIQWRLKKSEKKNGSIVLSHS